MCKPVVLLIQTYCFFHCHRRHRCLFKLPTNRSFKTAYEEVLGSRVSFACLLPGCIIPMTLYARCRNDWSIPVSPLPSPPPPQSTNIQNALVPRRMILALFWLDITKKA